MALNPSPWIELDGAANVRDLGGTTTALGRTVQPHRLIRSDNLQGLSEHDVRRLVDEVGVRRIADLRTDVEVRSEGPGPMTREPAVTIENLSLFVDAAPIGAAEEVDVVDSDAGPVILPWQQRRTDTERGRGIVPVYLGYLGDRADSVIRALRMIAQPDGATIVHCAAGKDRTGVVVAFALAAVGVSVDDIADDYARTTERIHALLARLVASQTYVNDIDPAQADRHSPRASTMHELFAELDAHHGGVHGWLAAHGWTTADQLALEVALLDEP